MQAPPFGEAGDMIKDEKPTIYYDGSCPLCRREIGFYQNQTGADALEWIDVSQSDNLDVVHGLSCEVAMKRFHVRCADGTMVSGAAAFFTLWAHLPRFSWIARLGRIPGMSHLMECVYRVFLLVRPTVQRIAVGMERNR